MTKVIEMTDTALANFAAAHGELVRSAANTPMLLHDATSVWFVAQGALDIFCAEHREGAGGTTQVPAAAAKHLLRAEVGQLVFGLPNLDGPLTVMGKGLADTVLLRLDAAALGITDGHDPASNPDLQAEAAQQATAWVSEIARAVSTDIELHPRISTLISSDSGINSDSGISSDSGMQELTVYQDNVLGVRQSEVVWISATADENAGALLYFGTEPLQHLVPNAPCWVPLTQHSWVTVTNPGYRAEYLSPPPQITGNPTGTTQTGTGKSSGLRIVATAQIEHGELLGALANFHRVAFGAEALNRRLLLADEVNAQTALSTHRRLARERTQTLLRSLGGGADKNVVVHGSALLAVLEQIGRHSGTQFREPRLPVTAPPATLEQVLEASGLRARQVRLTSEDRWWRTDSGAMLAYHRDSKEPVALLPSLRGYRAVGADGSTERVSASSAAAYLDSAWTIYPKLADNRPAKARDLLRLSRHGTIADLTRFIVAGLVTALFTQAPAIALGMLADWALPFNRGGALAQILVALAVVAIAATALTVFGGMALLRLEARVGARLSAAAWDRLLALPLPFFRNTIAGELAVRMSTFQRLRDLISGVVANVLASMIFLLPTLGVLFFYDPVLAAVAVLMSAVALVVIVGFGLAQIPHQRFWHTAVRTLSGRLLQFIGGITRIRASGAETAAFASWAGAYRDKQVAEIRSSRIDEHLAAFGAAYPFAFAAVLCAAVISRGDAVSVSDFAVSLTASLVLYASVADLGRATDALAEAFTAYEQITPVLEAVPERDTAVSTTPTVLEGELSAEQISFRYNPEGPPVLENVTISAHPGEFVAIVGGSGAGKSTLMRLMLGLETPQRGAMFFDGRDLRNLDQRSVRRQIGVVPQNSSLQPGSLAENIIGMADDLTLEDAWVAARLAAVDSDIAEMPMQMMTMVADRSGVFSGGQIQRIRIASALVREPRILILDEATSWLDARSQAEVMGSIEGLGATRIVIAHRLSTIKKADRIYVLDAGQVAQVGSYEELLDTPGKFRDLISRQIL
ncbi:MAG: ATP-binding cassette domain-containing protein [bacterium]|nr:ATP-binding cassette domain-containing protein [bacterium]